MAKLSPDYIKWVLTLNASQVQEEYHKLEKENVVPIEFHNRLPSVA